jgi:protoporphyrinogen oxidase
MVIIIGAGISGLTCAKYLKDKGIDALILEASDGVGGRVRTDNVQGFKLDRGFQVMLTSYPEARKLLDYKDLELKIVPSGARIRKGNHFFVMPNPLKNIWTAPQALIAPVGNFWDKLRVLQLNWATRNASEPTASDTRNQTTEAFLQAFGFSEKMMERFFRPFFRGVFLEKNLDTDADFFRFLFHHFSKGDVVIPSEGMQAIPNQIAAHLDPSQIRLNTKVTRIEGKNVHLENGEKLVASHIIVATEANIAAKLLDFSHKTAFNVTDCLYFTADKKLSYEDKSYIVINSNKGEAIAHIMVLSDVLPTYSPLGKTLISVSLVGNNGLTDDAMLAMIKSELSTWFGDNYQWQHIKTYRIPHALPQYFETSSTYKSLQINDFTYICGDYTKYPSLNGAMKSGREVADSVSNTLKVKY